ncbi:unnamed protein product, partial [Iphiclides podalirius]
MRAFSKMDCARDENENEKGTRRTITGAMNRPLWPICSKGKGELRIRRGPEARVNHPGRRPVTFPAIVSTPRKIALRYRRERADNTDAQRLRRRSGHNARHLSEHGDINYGNAYVSETPLLESSASEARPRR